MDKHIATEIAYKNGHKDGKEAVLKELMEVYNDLDKICDAAGDGKVVTQYDEDGNVIETTPYTMSNNAFNDVCGLWQNIRMILIKNGIQLP